MTNHDVVVATKHLLDAILKEREIGLGRVIKRQGEEEGRAGENSNRLPFLRSCLHHRTRLSNWLAAHRWLSWLSTGVSRGRS